MVVGNIVRARHHGGAELEERGGWGAGAGGWGEALLQEVVRDTVRALLARHHGGAELEKRGGLGKALLHGARGVLDSVVLALYPLDVSGVSATGAGRRVSESRVRKPDGKTARKEGEVSCVLGKKGAGLRVRMTGESHLVLRFRVSRVLLEDWHLGGRSVEWEEFKGSFI